MRSCERCLGEAAAEVEDGEAGSAPTGCCGPFYLAAAEGVAGIALAATEAQAGAVEAEVVMEDSAVLVEAAISAEAARAIAGNEKR